jgi:hypothetical protein
MSITTGPGRRATDTLVTAVGGGPRSWPSTSLSAATSAGIRCRTTRGIRIRVTIVVIMIEMVTVAAMVDIITAIRVV